jgi:hypothetical protein
MGDLIELMFETIFSTTSRFGDREKEKTSRKKIVRKKEEGENQRDSQRSKKKPWQKGDDRSKGLKGGQQYIETDRNDRSKR